MAQPNDGGKDRKRMSFRTWTDITGQHKTEAEFVEFKDEKVRLRKRDGRIVTVPIEKLSQVDREFVRQDAPDGHINKSDKESGGDTKSTLDRADVHPKQTAPQGNMDKPDDRPKQTASQGDMEEAKIFIIVNGQKFPKPGLETFFAQSGVGKDPQCTCNPVAGVFCSCNKVCTCVPVCGCVGHRSCSCVGHQSCGCVGHTSGGGGVVTGCRCAPVH